MSQEPKIINLPKKTESNQKIELKSSFLNNWIDSISNHVGANSVALGFFTRMILFFIVASLIVQMFWDKYPWLAGGIVALVLLADIGFTLSALMAAKFYKSKVMLYARVFFGISVFGLLFICWKLYDFTDLIYPILSESEYANKVEYNAVLYLRYSLNAIFFTTAILAFLFTEGGAYMIFTLTSKEEAKHETGETRNTETDANATFQTFLDYCKEAGLDKSEEKILPDVISKIQDNLYLIDNIEKTYEQIGGLKRSYKSKMNEEIENKSFEKGFQKFQIFQYWETIENIIKKNNEEYPTGTWSENVKVPEPYEQKEPKINGNKKPEYSK